MTQRLPGIRSYTTYMIDRNHTNILKRAKKVCSSNDPMYQPFKLSNTVSIQVLSDNLGLFIEMSLASLGLLLVSHFLEDLELRIGFQS